MNRYLTCLMIFVLSDLGAQDPYHIIYGIEDGLPSEEVYDVYVDSMDMVWVTTDRGVSRYNGDEFENFDSSDGLAYNTNFKIFTDHKDRLWFLGFDGSLSTYENGTFQESEFAKQIKTKKHNNFFYGMAYDSLGNIYAYHSALLNWYDHTSYYQFSPDGTVLQMTLTDSCELTTVDKDVCVQLLNYENARFVYIPSAKSFTTSNIRTGPRSGVFIYPISFREKYSATIADTEIMQLYSYEEDILTPVASSKSILNTVSLDHLGNVIVCSPQGIDIYRGGDLSRQPERLFENTAFSDMYQDRNHNYWFSSEKNGLYFIPTLDSRTFPQRGPRRPVDIIFPQGDHLFYYYGDNNMDYIDRTGSMKDVKPLENKILKDSFQLAKTGVMLYHSDSTYYYKSYGDLRRAFILKLTLSNGDELTATRDVKIKRNGKNIFHSGRNSDGLMSGTALRKTVLHGNDIWFSTLRYLYLIPDLQYDQLQMVMDRDSLLDVRINDFAFDSRGDRWIATIGNGVLYHTDTGIQQISVADGLVSNQINTLYLENDSTLWLGTNSGINYLQLSVKNDSANVKTMKSYSTKDGLLSNYINDITHWNDKLWVASKNGIQDISLNTTTSDALPTLAIKMVNIGDSIVDVSRAATMPYYMNSIVITYQGISYNRPKDTFYRYRMAIDDQKQQWIYTNNRSALFNNLTAGNYTFEVTARNKDDQWSRIESYSFEITPHFSSTWWFWILSILIVSVFLYYLYTQRLQYLINRNRQERKLKEATLRTTIAELSTFKNQFNPHFIFNSLNSIQNYIFKHDVRQANRFLSKFSKLIRESLNLSDCKYITIAKEIDFISKYLELEFLRFPGKFEYRIEIEDGIETDLYCMPPLLLQPVVENVVKHAFKGKNKGLLTIKLIELEVEDVLVIHVQDDGTGIVDEDEINTNTKRKSFGMKIIRDRIELLKIDYPNADVSFDIRNNAGQSGTIATFTIPRIKIYTI